MISKDHRVPRTKIAYILKKGENTTSRLFIARYAPNHLKSNRYRTVVSKKIDKSAVKRNQLRRRIYEAISKKSTSKPSKTHFDLILIPKAHIIESQFAQIETDIANLTSSLPYEQPQ